MNLRMSVQKSPKLVTEFRHAGPNIALGRNPEGDLVVDHDAVSWEHARIELSPYQATLIDLNSTNGTFKNGQKIAPSVPLWPGDTIRLGQTGPTLTVLELDLTSNGPVPPPIPPVVKTAIPVAKAAKSAVSETRGIAMQAVQELMAQQSQLKAQHEAHERHKRTFAITSLIVFLVLLLLAGGLFLFRNDLGLVAKKTDENNEELRKQGQTIEKTAENVRQLGVQVDAMADHFGKLDQQMDEQKQRQEKTDQTLSQLAVNAAKAEAAQRGGLEKMGASLEQINDRLTKLNDKPGGGVLAKGPAVARPPAILAKPIRIEPGQKVDVIVKNKGYYTGSYVGMNEKTVRVQTIPDATAKPSEWDIRDVQAFQTRDGIFAYNEELGQFETAVTFFRYNRSNQLMERMENSQDTYLAQDAQVFGPTNSARALLSLGSAGEWCVGLPLPASKSPQSLPAYHFKEIVTSKGVYSYDDKKQDFVYKSHTEYAQEAKEANDKYWEQWRQNNWKRRVEETKLGTERLKALAGLFWRPWVWW